MRLVVLPLLSLGGCLLGWPGIDPVGHEMILEPLHARLDATGPDGNLWRAGGPNPWVRIRVLDADDELVDACASAIRSKTREPTWEVACPVAWDWGTRIEVAVVDERDGSPAKVSELELVGRWEIGAFDIMDAEPAGELVLEGADGVVEQLVLGLSRGD